MKIKELIEKANRVERVTNALIRKLPKPNEFRVDYIDPFAKRDIELSLEDVKETIDCLVWLQNMLQGTINSIEVKDIWSIDNYIK